MCVDLRNRHRDPDTQLVYNVKFRVLVPPQRRVMTAPDQIVLTLIDVYCTHPFVALNAVACEVIEPEVARLQVRHF